MLTRRQLIAGTAAGALAPALPALDLVRPKSFSFAFFSDTHVGVKANLKENEAMLREIAEWRPAFAVNGGDVTDYGWAAEYANWRELRKILECPVHCNMGNHDVRWSPLGPKAFADGTGDPLYHSFEHEGCLFVVLDSTVPLSHWGHFEKGQLDWMARELKRVGRATPVFLFTHHWIGRDKIQVDNEEDLVRLLTGYNVKLIFNGHGHSDLLWHVNDVPNTMNKGLYQGSWQRIDVDRERNEVRLTRRSATAGKSGLLVTVPLSPTSVPASEPTAVRFDDGPFVPLATVPAVAPYRKTFLLGPDRVRMGTEPPKRTPEGAVWSRALSGGVMSQLRAEGDSLIVTQMDGAALRVRQSDGKVLWRRETKGGYAHSTPLTTDRLVIFGTADGTVHALDRESGRPRWRRKTGGPVYGSAVAIGDLVAIPSGDGFVYGLDRATGEVRWRRELPRSETSFVQSPLATDGRLVFAGAWDKAVYALDGASGEVAWRREATKGKSFAYSPAIGNPVVAGDRVVVPANGNSLWCFRATDGEVVWEAVSPGDKFGYSSPRIANGRVYVGCLGDLGEGRCVDLASGEIVWTAATGATIYDAGPALVGRWAVFGSVSGLLTAVDRATGGLGPRLRMPPGHLLSTPVGVGSRLFVASYANVLCAFDLPG